jgi:archaellum biogenesis ATPase FlaH
MEKMYVKDVSLHNSTWNLTRTQRIYQELLWVKTFGALDVIIVDDINPMAQKKDVIRMLMLKLLDMKGMGIPFGGC